MNNLKFGDIVKQKHTKENAIYIGHKNNKEIKVICPGAKNEINVITWLESDIDEYKNCGFDSF